MINNRRGQPDPRSWLNEGDGQLHSSRVLRARWQRLRRSFRKLQHNSESRLQIDRAFLELSALPRSSVLLLGYAVEMYLKAGLAKLYKGCRAGMFTRDCRQLYGHKYVDIAEAINFPLTQCDREVLLRCRDLVLDKSRYPVQLDPELDENHPDRFNAINKNTIEIWHSGLYRQMHALAIRISAHSRLIDSDPSDVACFGQIRHFGSTGYLIARSGGRLRSRITFRYSDEQKDAKQDTPEALREIVRIEGWSLESRIWDDADLVFDSGTKTCLVRRAPTSTFFLPSIEVYG